MSNKCRKMKEEENQENPLINRNLIKWHHHKTVKHPKISKPIKEIQHYQEGSQNSKKFNI